MDGHDLLTGRRGSRRLGLLLAALIGLGAVLGTGALMARAEYSHTGSGIGTRAVSAIDDRFEPPSIQVSLGSRVIVRWGGEQTNDDPAGSSSGQLNAR